MHRKRQKHTKYSPLQRYLEGEISRAEVELTFSKIEEILGSVLPTSAFNYREWWSNQKDISRRPQSYAWQKAGFDVHDVHLNKKTGWVRFSRK